MSENHRKPRGPHGPGGGMMPGERRRISAERLKSFSAIWEHTNMV